MLLREINAINFTLLENRKVKKDIVVLKETFKFILKLGRLRKGSWL